MNYQLEPVLQVYRVSTVLVRSMAFAEPPSFQDFCGTGCQTGFGGCGPVAEPSCGGYTMTKTIGYSWASTRSCDKRLPSDIDVAPLTHINLAFAFFHPTTFKVMPMNAGDETLYPQFTALKAKKPSLKTWIAVGGWSFNDATNSPNTQTAFSDMASSAAHRQTFITSLINFMQTRGFNGVDLDREVSFPESIFSSYTY
ncbi:glycoside hydrolase superfamily [Aspergillus cavernicola]|uniref:Glycoside hydrolase superfamily n=1 Tax=Aspergillus cavernicola TaxID=176166 RepID=A0ABR4HEY8_9EURO